ncbi:hypothetical protein E2C01_000704 [Portunus trituberculatus]|uniref:Uncharacterized protein n=1 Tax=Portunus trituberculatus TaxID=210409 RepID=A0A5B7CFV7_PORTR|nr:hypothetical protein [Portunus trituberculatus]
MNVNGEPQCQPGRRTNLVTQLHGSGLGCLFLKKTLLIPVAPPLSPSRKFPVRIPRGQKKCVLVTATKKDRPGP